MRRGLQMFLRMSIPRPKFRISREGAKLTSRQAVLLGLQRKWTAKETAFETGWTINAIQTCAGRMKVSLVYAGVGRKPTYANGTSKKDKGSR